MTAAGPEPVAAPANSRPQRPRVRELLVLLGCVAAAVIAVVAGAGGHVSTPRPAAAGRPLTSGSGLTIAQRARQRAIATLLAERSAGLLHHDRTAFVATLDPDSPIFRRSQLRMFGNLAKVAFSHWSYEFAPASTPQQQAGIARYGVPAFAPASAEERYSIAGFDPIPTVLTVYPTFVERSGRWYLASLTGQRSLHETSDTQIWDYGQVDVVRRGRVLVLGPPSELATMRAAAVAAQAAIPRVTAVWGANWPRRVVIQVPDTEREMSRITDDRGDLHRIAALTSTETSAGNSGPTPVGDRVTLNPVLWPQLSATGVQVVLTHELTHVASRDYTDDSVPKWLSEGFADYVGYLDLGRSSPQLAPELTTLVQDGAAPAALPGDRAFDGANPKIAVAYEEGWMACRYVAARYGASRLVRFYRAVGRSADPAPQAVAAALHSVLHLTPRQFQTVWHRYLRQQL